MSDINETSTLIRKLQDKIALHQGRTQKTAGTGAIEKNSCGKSKEDSAVKSPHNFSTIVF